MYLFVIGPKGAGKTTLGCLLAHTQNVPHYSMGAILRAWKAGHAITPEGIDVHGIQHSGKAPWGILQQIFRRAPEGFILDGFPRYTDQLARLLDSLRSRKKPFYFVAVQASPEVCRQRVLSRALDGDRVEVVARYNQAVEDMLARQNLLYRVDTSQHAPEVLADHVTEFLTGKGIVASA